MADHVLPGVGKGFREAIRSAGRRLWGLFVKEGRSVDGGLAYIRALEAMGEQDDMLGSVLECGSGPRGMAPYRRRRFVGVDSSFWAEVSEWLLPVTASCAALPFRRKAFDTVVSVDLLEHVSPEERPRAIREMLRVCGRRVVLIFPSGPLALKQDRELDRRYRKWHGEGYIFSAAHLKFGLPDEESVREVFEEAGEWDVTRFRSGNLRLRKCYMLLWMFPSAFTNRLYYLLSWFLPLFRLLDGGVCYRTGFVATRKGGGHGRDR